MTLISTSDLVIPRGPSIIVVGPDRVGKTTTVKHISERLGVPSFKCPAEKRIFKEGGRSSLAFDYTLTHLLQQTGFRFVSDRGYPCEWTYSKVFGRETDEHLLELIDVSHAHLGTKILYLYSSKPPREEDDIVPAEKYEDIRRTYDKFAEWSACKVTSIDVCDMLDAFAEGDDISRSVAKQCIEAMGLK